MTKKIKYSDMAPHGSPAENAAGYWNAGEVKDVDNALAARLLTDPAFTETAASKAAATKAKKSGKRGRKAEPKPEPVHAPTAAEDVIVAGQSVLERDSDK